MTRAVSAALDLGSTRLKLAVLHDDGTLQVLGSSPFPLRTGEGLRYEIDLAELERRAAALVRLAPPALPLGVAAQRSSFALWDLADGSAAAEAISWRDRRAADWCDAHARLGARVEGWSGLRLSPHYVGPKLAHLLATRPELATRVRAGGIACGTLESYLLWRWSARAIHATDRTMAARTLLFDVRSGAWSDEALRVFGLDGLRLPQLVATSGQQHVLGDGRRWCASIADQASGALAVASDDDVLVNFGTGAFVLRRLAELRPTAGYLCGPILWTPAARAFALEGTINGGGSTLARFAGPTRALEENDQDPALFASPDESGLGAPRWIARASLAFSDEAAAPAAKRRAWLEGLVFRVREIVDDIGAGTARVLVSGGLAREPFLAPALATCLARPVELLDEGESTLLGVARLAAGLDARGPTPSTSVTPLARAAWLTAKYERWRTWMDARWRA